jgi:hypothetical protein
MVRVLDEDGFQVQIWLNDHEPAHVHVYRAEGLVVINVAPLQVRAAHDVGRRDVRRAMELVSGNQLYLLRRWREIHGR